VSIWGVILFHTNSSVLRAEKVLRRSGLAVRIVPTPRELSSDCGISLRFEWIREAEARRLLDEAGVEVQGIHPLPLEGPRS
jgi:hypothetical protein